MKSRLSDEERGAEEADDAELAEQDDTEAVCSTRSAVPCRRRKPECGENVYFPILLPTELCPEGSTITFKELPRPSDGKPALLAVVDDPHNEDEQITLELCEMTPNGEEHSSWLLDDLVTSRIFLIFLFSLIFLFFLILIFSFVFIFPSSFSLFFVTLLIRSRHRHVLHPQRADCVWASRTHTRVWWGGDGGEEKRRKRRKIEKRREREREREREKMVDKEEREEYVINRREK